MSDILPIEKEWTVHKNIDEVVRILVKSLKSFKGRIVESSSNRIVCDFGSLLLSRLLGEFWVSRATLPKRAEIQLEPTGDSETVLKLVVRETHKYGIKAGYVKKYQQALQEISDAICDSIR